jgi:hypothetical protein
MNDNFTHIYHPSTPFDGTWYYDTEGRFHRLDGPAVEYQNGTKVWFYHGKHIHVANQIEYERYLKLKAFW